MLPTTPTGWNTVPNRNRNRRIISPDDNDQDIDNNNPFGLLEDSDSEDDASTTSSTTSVVETAQGISDAAYLVDPVSTLNSIAATTSSVLVDSGSTDHIVTTYRTVDISRQYLELVPTEGTQLEYTVLRNQPYIDNILENFYTTVPDELPALYTPNSDDDDTASTVSISSIGSMGKDLPSIDDHLGREFQSPASSNYNFADAVVSVSYTHLTLPTI